MSHELRDTVHEIALEIIEGKLEELVEEAFSRLTDAYEVAVKDVASRVAGDAASDIRQKVQGLEQAVKTFEERGRVYKAELMERVDLFTEAFEILKDREINAFDRRLARIEKPLVARGFLRKAMNGTTNGEVKITHQGISSSVVVPFGDAISSLAAPSSGIHRDDH